MNGWKEMNLGVKVLIFLAVFILLGLLAAIFIIFRSQGELDRELAKLKRAGEPITIKDLRPAPVADKDNAAFVYKKIFALMTAKNHPFSAEYRGDLKPEINKLEKFYRGEAPLHGLNKNEKAELYNLLDSRLIAEIIRVS